MKKTEAEFNLNNLKIKSSLSLDEATMGYQLSLALCDHKQAIYFKELYNDLSYKFFLEIASNIEKQKYVELFMQYSKIWSEVIGPCSKEILIAIILLKQDEIIQWNDLTIILNEGYVNISKVENSNLAQMSFYELSQLFIKNLEIPESYKPQVILSNIGSNTDNLELAKKTLTYIIDERDDLKEHIIANIANLVSLYDINESIKLLDGVDKHYSDPIRFDIAKRIYKTESIKPYKMLENMEKKYMYAYGAYIAANNKDIKTIEKIVAGLDALLDVGSINHDNYDYSIMEVAISIVCYYPIYAYSLQDKLHTNLGCILDLQLLVSSELFKRDTNMGIEYFKKIEVEFFKTEAILNIVQENNNLINLVKLKEVIDIFEINMEKYRALYALNKKIPIDFEEIYEITSKIMPYDELELDYDIQTQYHVEKYINAA
ncbi:MAG: hypothetical protein K8R44_06225 [Sulfurimonas sp.]|nr:hypothetical protein [Sulfurimonas sp.]